MSLLLRPSWKSTGSQSPCAGSCTVCIRRMRPPSAGGWSSHQRLASYRGLFFQDQSPDRADDELSHLSGGSPCPMTAGRADHIRRRHHPPMDARDGPQGPGEGAGVPLYPLRPGGGGVPFPPGGTAWLGADRLPGPDPPRRSGEADGALPGRESRCCVRERIPTGTAAPWATPRSLKR